MQFENGPDGNLGHPVGCLPDELTQSLASRETKTTVTVDA